MAEHVRKTHQKSIDKAIKSSNPAKVKLKTVPEQEVKLPLLPGEKPAPNPNTPSGLHFGRKQRIWKRSDGVNEQRIQAYMEVEIARRMRVFCAERNISIGSFLQRATEELLNQIPSGK